MRVNRFAFTMRVQRAISIVNSFKSVRVAVEDAEVYGADVVNLQALLLDLADMAGAPAVPLRPDEFERAVDDALGDFCQVVRHQLDLWGRRPRRRR